MAIILGIDPGSRITGYGLINWVGQKTEFIDCGCIRVTSDSLPARLSQIYSGLHEVIQRHCPQEVAIEQIFMARNADSALKLGQARGAAIVAAVNNLLPVAEYSARQVKQSVVGKGAADKTQVQHMVRYLLKLTAAPQADAADALAVALCHAHTQSSLVRIVGATGFRRGRVR